MKKTSKLVPALVVIIIILSCAVGALAWKGGYLSRIVTAFAPSSKVGYQDNVQYKERTSLFSAYAHAQADIVFVGDSITHQCDFNELLGINNSVNRGIGSDTTEGVLVGKQ